MGRNETPTTKPFAEALAELLRERHFTTQTGNISWHAFARELNGLSDEALRKVLAGQRSVTQHVIEEVARVLELEPGYFVEWRALEAARDFDVNAVGFEQVLANLERWSSEAASARSKRRRA